MAGNHTSRGSGPKRLLAWGAAALVIVAAILIAIERWPHPPLNPVTATLEKPAQALSAATAVPLPSPATAKKAPSPAATATGPGATPSFDIVRIDPDGNAVIAGRAPPGNEVTIMDGKKVLGHAVADASGSWLWLSGKPLPAGSHELTLTARGKDGVVRASAGAVAMLVPKPPTSAGGASGAGTPAIVARSEPSAASSPASSGGGSAIAVLMPKSGPVKPLQLPRLKGKNPLSLDVIEYGKKGGVTIQGRSAPEATIKIYLGNKPVGTATANAQGQWQITAGRNIPPGRYRLRLEARGGPGREVARLVMPFERDLPPAHLVHDLFVVQPGNSLWRIARRSYGHGIEYVFIYHANQHQIRNPNLIFPGQLLKVPGRS
ncbi:MAG: LysM peptidoglycan-binding domain-containing protein [Stellaceae bacterium]